MGLFDNYNFGGNSQNPLEGLLSLIGQQQSYNPQSAGLGPMDQQPRFDSAMFDPSTYAPSGPAPGGTDFYGQNRNVAVGDYQMPQFGNPAQQPATTANAQLPVNAQQTQFQPQAAQEPGFGDRLLAGLSGFGNGGREGGLIGALTGGIEGLSNGVNTQNQTAQALIARGIEPSIANSVVKNPALLKAVLPQILKGSKTEYGLNPIYGTDPVTGEQVLGTIGKDGSFKKIDTGGVKIQSGVDKIDLGTHFQLRDKRTGQVIGVEPKDLKGAESQKALGKAQGGMQASLPSDIQNAEQTIKQIDELVANKGLDSIVGPVDQFRPSYLLDENGRDALARYNQLKGKAFLSAYATLRGGGQITEVEGVKAENAMARMDRAQSEADFRAALTDFRDAVKTGMEKLREKAGAASPVAEQSPAAGAPDRAAVEAEMRKRGLLK